MTQSGTVDRPTRRGPLATDAAPEDSTRSEPRTEDPGLVSGQFRFFDAQVLRTRRLGPTLTRITFGGPQLAGFASGGRDQSFSLLLPHPGQDAPLLPDRTGDGWYGAWRALPETERAVVRSYTVRAQRRDPDEVDVDFALHGTGPDDPPGAAGPASHWAAGATPGDRVVLLGPAFADNRSVGFRPPPGTDWVLLAADETALPALGGILEQLPADTVVRAWIEVPHPADIQDLPHGPGSEIVWLVREPGAAQSPLAEAVRSAALPGGTPYAWLAGEASAVRALRRHLVREVGVDRTRVTFSGYWRRGASEEQLRAERAAAAAS